MVLNSYKIIGQAVQKYWEDYYPQDVVVYFKQKYGYESNWRQCYELVICTSDTDKTMEFLNDFCEGETDVKDIRIITLDSILYNYGILHDII